MEPRISYESFPDGAVAIYDRDGGALELLTGEPTDEDIRKAAVKALVSTGGYLRLGVMSKELPYVELTKDQIQKIKTAAAKKGFLPYVTQQRLAKALGITRQAVFARLERGTLEGLKLPEGTVVPVDSLDEETRRKVLNV